jgi:hypothetical protein
MEKLFFRLAFIFALTFSLFLSGCQQQTDPRDMPPKYTHTQDHPLTGTTWYWDSEWSANRRTLFFETADRVIYQDGTQFTESYVYDKNEKQGKIDAYGEFSVTDDYETMLFPNWKNYGHGAEYKKVDGIK